MHSLILASDNTFGQQVIIAEIAVVTGVILGVAKGIITRAFGRIEKKFTEMHDEYAEEFSTIRAEEAKERITVNKHRELQDRAMRRIQIIGAALIALTIGILVTRLGWKRKVL
jgi:Na+/glutamate symporter